MSGNDNSGTEKEIVTFDETSLWYEDELQGSSDGQNKQILKDRFASDGEEMDHTEPCTAIDDLMFALADWATEFNISLVALSALLSILLVHHPFLPKD